MIKVNNKIYPSEYGTEEVKWLMDNESKLNPPKTRSVPVVTYTDENITNKPVTKSDVKFNKDVLFNLGGEFLVKLYELNSNLGLVAEEMGITYNAAVVRLHRIREKLRNRRIYSRDILISMLIQKS